MRTYVLLMTLFLCLPMTAIYAAEAAREEIDLGAGVYKALDEYELEVDKKLIKVQAEIADLRRDLIKDLEKELQTQTRRGNLKVALAIQEQIDELQAETATKDVFGTDVTEANNKFKIVGRWLCENDGYYELRIFDNQGNFKLYQSDEKAGLGKLIVEGAYEIGATGLVEAKNNAKKTKNSLQTVGSDGLLVVKVGSKQYTGRRLK